MLDVTVNGVGAIRAASAMDDRAFECGKIRRGKMTAEKMATMIAMRHPGRTFDCNSTGALMLVMDCMGDGNEDMDEALELLQAAADEMSRKSGNG